MAAAVTTPGVVVVLIALWTVAQAFRKGDVGLPGGPAQVHLVLERRGVGLPADGFWPLRAVLPVLLRAAVRLDHPQPGQVHLTSSNGRW